MKKNKKDTTKTQKHDRFLRWFMERALIGTFCGSAKAITQEIINNIKDHF